MELKKERNNIFSALFFVLLGLALRFYIIPWGVPLRAAWGGEVAVNSRTFPNFAAVCILLAALGQLFVSIRQYHKLRTQNTEGQTAPRLYLRGELRSGLLFALFLSYALLFRYVGFLPASVVVPPIVLFVMGSRKWTHYLATYLFIGSLYVIFAYLLKVRLP